ncbi:IS1634 family transposase, partial [Dethiosulfovibrio salsuginis]
PAVDEEVDTFYHPQLTLELKADAVERLRNKLGRFILATSAVGEGSPSAEEILSTYKDQSSVEKGFRFLKDPSFHASEIYLKRQERIEGLMLLMVFALVVYNLAEMELREKLSKAGESIPDPNGKPMKSPTLKRLFGIFSRISVLVLQDEATKAMQVMNLKDTHKRVLCLFGRDFERYYENSPALPESSLIQI